MAFLRLDPMGCLLTSLNYRAEFCRNPQAAANALLSKDSIYTPEHFHARLGPESALVMMQHAFPWRIREGLTTPILYLAGENDAVIPERAQRRCATAYSADYVMVPKAAHNLMMERTYADIAGQIRDWLEQRQLP